MFGQDFLWHLLLVVVRIHGHLVIPVKSISRYTMFFVSFVNFCDPLNDGSVFLNVMFILVSKEG